MGKYICTFLAGMLFGMMLAMWMTLVALDNRIDNLEPTIEDLIYQVDVLNSGIHGVDSLVDQIDNQSRTVCLLLDDCIWTLRSEINDYNEAGR